MGTHAFAAEPGQVSIYRDTVGTPLALAGADDGWNMPVVRNAAVLSGDTDYGGVDHFVMTYHLAGGQVRRLDAAEFDGVADAGAISLQVPGSAARFESDPDRPVEYAHLYFRRSLIDEVADAGGLGHAGRARDFFAVRKMEIAQDLRAYVGRAVNALDRPSAIEMDSRAYLLGLGLLRFWSEAGAGSPHRTAGRLSPRQLARVHALVEERISDDLRLSDMAQAAALSPFHFARAFKATTGETPAAFVTRRRLEIAQDLLVRTRLPIAVVAYRAGFSSHSHLTRRLKGMTGATPSELRAQAA